MRGASKTPPTCASGKCVRKQTDGRAARSPSEVKVEGGEGGGNTHTHMHTHMHTHTHMRTNTHVHIRTNTYKHTHTYIHIIVYIYIYIYASKLASERSTSTGVAAESSNTHVSRGRERRRAAKTEYLGSIRFHAAHKVGVGAVQCVHQGVELLLELLAQRGTAALLAGATTASASNRLRLGGSCCSSSHKDKCGDGGVRNKPGSGEMNAPDDRWEWDAA